MAHFNIYFNSRGLFLERSWVVSLALCILYFVLRFTPHIAGCEVEDVGYTPNGYISCLKCLRDDGGSEFASLVLSTCPIKELVNRNGVLVCAATAGPTPSRAADAAPPPTPQQA